MARKSRYTNEDYIRLAREWKLQDQLVQSATSEQGRKVAVVARNKVATEILGGLKFFLIKTVKRMTRHWEAYYEDCLALAQEAVITKALPNFDEEKASEAGKTFYGYVRLWVFSVVQRGIDKNHMVVKVPVNKRIQVRRMRANEEVIPDDLLDCDPSIISGDVMVGDEKDVELRDLLTATPASQGNAAVNRDYIRHLTACLTDKESFVFFKVAADECTFQDVATELSISRERVRQIYRAAQEKMQQRAQQQNA